MTGHRTGTCFATVRPISYFGEFGKCSGKCSLRARGRVEDLAMFGAAFLQVVGDAPACVPLPAFIELVVALLLLFVCLTYAGRGFSRRSHRLDPAPEKPDGIVEEQRQLEQQAAVVPPPLSASEQGQVQRGELIFRPYRNDLGVNRGVAVQRVHAPPSLVWQCLCDFESYPRMVADVCAAHVYESNGTDIKVAVSIGYGPVHLTTCLHHVYAPELEQLTWSLDAAQPSSFRVNDGFWLVRPDPSDAAYSIVYYSIAVELKGWVPGWVNGFVAKQGLPRAVAWVKREAEARATAAPVVAPRIKERPSAAPAPPTTPNCLCTAISALLKSNA